MIILLPFLIMAIVWMLAAPGATFLRRFITLLEEPTIRQGRFRFLSGRSSAVGRFGGRDVAINLQLKRSRHSPGYLVLGVRTAEVNTLDHNGIAARLHDAAGRSALAALVAQDLVLDATGGWLRARWEPHGFVIFPGRFSEARWRSVLEALHIVATSLEASAS